MVASRFLAAAAASVILLRFAPESRKLPWNGCVKVANGVLAADFSHFGIDDVPFIFLLKSAPESSFFRFGVEIRFWSCKSLPFVEPCGATLSIALCNSVSADRSGMVTVASRFLAAAAASVILLCFAPESRKLPWNGRVKVTNGVLAADFSHFGFDDFPFIFLLKSASESSFFRFGVEIRFWSCKSLPFVEPCGAILYCALQLSVCRSQWNGYGCVKVPRSCSCKRNIIAFCTWKS